MIMRWEDVNRMGIREMSCEVEKQVELAQDYVH
jgi:hypothetical protein